MFAAGPRGAGKGEVGVQMMQQLWSGPLLLASVVLQAVLLRVGFQVTWWKAAAAALIGSVLGGVVLSLLGLADGVAAESVVDLLGLAFRTFAVLVIVEAPVVFAFAGRRGWRRGVMALLVGSLASASVLTAVRPPQCMPHGHGSCPIAF